MSDLKDPRVFFAAERTLLAWCRTSLALMAIGFAIERSGLLINDILPETRQPLGRALSFWAGAGFLFLGAIVAFWSAFQHRQVLKTFHPAEIPEGYHTKTALVFTLIVFLLGLVVLGYLFLV